jgi:hypothetical protein
MIKVAFPPNYEDIKKLSSHQPGVIYCYGQDIYNPDDCYIDDYQLTHEGVHTRQQGDNPTDWWRRYLLDVDFRFVCELEAFQAQYKHFCRDYKDRNRRNSFLVKLAISLSSDTYGKICTQQEAIKAINSKLEFKV